MLRRIDRDQARLGMFVHDFDGPWLRHPFWRPRFLLSSPRDLARVLDSALETLVIDESRGAALHPDAVAGEPPARSARPVTAAPASFASGIAREHSCSFEEERPRAAKLLKQSTREMKRLFGEVRAGKAIRCDDFAPLVEQICASVTRNSHALISLSRLRSRDDYTYVHSVAVSALMMRFARSLDMAPDAVFDLGLAGLLHDVGEMIVPERILTKPGSLSDEEFAVIRSHPEQGYRLLSGAAELPEVVVDVCRHHHERSDGSGYPLRLAGEEISVAARIAAICDVYDALTSDRAYKAAWSPAEAITRMHGWAGHFDPELLFRFMRTLGLFPEGLLVELRSNRLGVVLPNGRRASRPLVRAFFSTRERAAMPLEDVVIDDSLAQDQIIAIRDPLAWGFPDWAVRAEQLMTATLRQPARAA
ncbi:HD-GYP domain-containing protein [Sphingomonas aracearum]|nr:HD-GYP domain-containing protein [Sphingomonas aracearum]